MEHFVQLSTAHLSSNYRKSSLKILDVVCNDDTRKLLKRLTCFSRSQMSVKWLCRVLRLVIFVITFIIIGFHFAIYVYI